MGRDGYNGGSRAVRPREDEESDGEIGMRVQRQEPRSNDDSRTDRKKSSSSKDSNNGHQDITGLKDHTTSPGKTRENLNDEAINSPRQSGVLARARVWQVF